MDYRQRRLPGPRLTVSDHGWAHPDYGAVQELSWRAGRALDRSGVRPGEKVAILSANDPVAFGCVFGISRAGAVWCPVNPRNEAAENRDLLALFDCRCLIFQAAFAPSTVKQYRDIRANAEQTWPRMISENGVARDLRRIAR